MASLTKAGQDQKALYDFSCANLSSDSIGNNIGILCLLCDDELKDQHNRFLDMYSKQGKAGAVIVTDKVKDLRLQGVRANMIVTLSHETFKYDPLLVRQHIAMKMVLNAHSTCVMAKLGKLVGNTMTNVSPANLKLIGRSTALILMHVNDKLAASGFKLGYDQANAVLYDVIR